MFELTMPSFGADMDDGVLVEWRIEPGQAVKRGDIVAVVETQKGAIDVEVWRDGTVARLLAEPGQRLPVGAPLARLATEGEDWQAVAQGSPAPAAAARPAAPASPAARKRAAELGLDLSALVPASPGAPITLADVERAAANTKPAPPAAGATALPPAEPGAEGMRAAIAAAMTRSKREIPHYYLGTEVDVEAALQWLEDFNAQRGVGERVLFAAVALRAIALALRKAPQLNGRYVDGRFVGSEAVHLGVVTSLRGGGLVVPTLHDADRLALPALMAALGEVLQRARSGALRSSDLADSTVSVTNLGDLGADTVYGAIYPPQVALVGLGRVATRAVVHEGAIVAARTVQVTLAADHRASDGLTGARFLADVRERLQKPEAL